MAWVFGELILSSKTWVSDGRPIRVYVVGKSGNGAGHIIYSSGGGGSGGIAVSEYTYAAGTQITCTISASETVFGSMRATAGGNGAATGPGPGGGGGTASGGNIANISGFAGGSSPATYGGYGNAGGNSGMRGGTGSPSGYSSGTGGGGGARYGGDGIVPYLVSTMNTMQGADAGGRYPTNSASVIPTPVASAALRIYGGGGGGGGAYERYSDDESNRQSGGAPSTGQQGMIIIDRPDNVAPSTPSSITVPATIQSTVAFTVSWSASTDLDGNLAGYALERSLSGGAWARVFTGNALNRSETVPAGTTTVQYRVAAYDALNAFSGWQTSAVRTVINNVAPTITSDTPANLGVKDAGFEIAYTVDDANGGDVTVTERINGNLHRTYTAALGVATAMAITDAQFVPILNGEHTIAITATDNESASTTLIRTFTRATTAINFEINPILADKMPTKCIINVQGAFPAGSVLTVKACNNALDDAPTWEDITTSVQQGRKYFFDNVAKTADDWAFGLHVQLERGVAVGDCHISSTGGNFE